jgi:undecaprenyl-diphosphatase
MMDDPSGRNADAGAAGELRRDRFVGGRDLTRWHSRLGRALVTAVQRVARWLGPHAALVLTLLVGMALVVGLSAAAAGVYDAVTEADGVAGLDEPILAAVMRIRVPWLNTAVTAYTDIAGVVVMPVIAIGVMLLLAIGRRSWTPVILIVAAGAGSLLMTIAGKNIVGRVRPDLADAVPPYEHSPSFPSGHTLNAVVIAGIIAYLLVLRQRHTGARILTITLATLFAVTVAASRVYLGHHWFTDVLAAFFLGLAWLALVITAHRLYLTVWRRIPPQGSHVRAPRPVKGSGR